MAPYSKAVIHNALRNTAIVNRAIDTTVGIWDLEPTRERAPETSMVKSYSYKADSMESVVGSDDRTRVHPSQFAEGGKYRFIVKLFLHYEGQGDSDNWALGTGWLIAPDLLVTAGHCAYDYSHKLGKLTKVKCYIGYNGKSSINDHSVQFRQGKRVAAPAEWLKGPQEVYDVSFITLDRPFTGVKPVKYEDTPEHGHMCLGVVGYPGDLDKGEYMYEHFVHTSFDLASSKKMLTYEIDTFGGNSGSPVLRQDDLISIGVHAYGGSINKASVIGPLGNVFSDFIYAVRSPVLGKTTPQGIRFMTVPTGSVCPPSWHKHSHDHTNGFSSYRNGESGYHSDEDSHHKQGSTRQNGHSHYGNGNGSYRSRSLGARLRSNRKPLPRFDEDEENHSHHSHHSHRNDHHHDHFDQEGFFEDFGKILKKGISIAAPIASKVISTATPLLGPIGAPIGAIAGMALQAAGKMATESEFGTESAIDGTDVANAGLQERAVLGEAALQMLMEMDQQTLREDGVFDTMADTAKKIGPAMKQAAPHVLPAIMPTALTVAAATSPGGTECSLVDEWPPADHHHHYRSSNGHTHFPDRKTREFADHLTGALAEEHPNSEGFISDFVSKALSVAAPVVKDVAKQGLPFLVKVLTGKTESYGPEPSSAASQSVDGIVDRAILQECALTAVMQMPPQRLQEEGFFDIIKTVVQKVGPVVMKAAPAVIKAVVPIVGQALKTESGYCDDHMSTTGYGRGSLRKKRSAVFGGFGGTESSFLDSYHSWERSGSGRMRAY